MNTEIAQYVISLFLVLCIKVCAEASNTTSKSTEQTFLVSSFFFLVSLGRTFWLELGKSTHWSGTSTGIRQYVLVLVADIFIVGVQTPPDANFGNRSYTLGSKTLRGVQPPFDFSGNSPRGTPIEATSP